MCQYLVCRIYIIYYTYILVMPFQISQVVCSRLPSWHVQVRKVKLAMWTTDRQGICLFFKPDSGGQRLAVGAVRSEESDNLRAKRRWHVLRHHVWGPCTTLGGNAGGTWSFNRPSLCDGRASGSEARGGRDGKETKVTMTSKNHPPSYKRTEECACPPSGAFVEADESVHPWWTDINCPKLALSIIIFVGQMKSVIIFATFLMFVGLQWLLSRFPPMKGNFTSARVSMRSQTTKHLLILLVLRWWILFICALAIRARWADFGGCALSTLNSPWFWRQNFLGGQSTSKDTGEQFFLLVSCVFSCEHIQFLHVVLLAFTMDTAAGYFCLHCIMFSKTAMLGPYSQLNPWNKALIKHRA